jgi:hypothetical protein
MTERLIDTKQPKARKNYICESCGGVITKGETYLYKIFISADNKSFNPKRFHLPNNCVNSHEVFLLKLNHTFLIKNIIKFLRCFRKLF